MKWEKRKLGTIVKLVTGKTPPTANPKYFGGDLLWINPSDFTSKYLLSSTRSLTLLAVADKKCNVLPKGTVLLSCIGDIGKVGILNDSGTSNQQITGLIPNTEVIPEYLYYFLLQSKSKLDNLANKAVVAILNNERLKEFEILLPPIPIQKQIADILDKADALRKKDQQLLQKYEELAQAIFIDMFGDPVQNEKGWTLKRLEQLCDISSGSTPSRQRPEYFQGSVPWVKTTEVKGVVINETEEKISEQAIQNSSCRLNPINSIIIAMYGQGKTRGNVGLLGIEATTNQACGVLKPNESYNSVFLFFTLKIMYAELRKLGRGGNQENLNLQILKNFEVYFPPKNMQDEFAKRFALFAKIKNTYPNSHSGALFDSLIQRAFNGELIL